MKKGLLPSVVAHYEGEEVANGDKGARRLRDAHIGH